MTRIRDKIETQETTEKRTGRASSEDQKSAAVQFTPAPELRAILSKVRVLFRCRLAWLEHLIDLECDLLEQDEPENELAWRCTHLHQEMEKISQYDRDIEAIESSRFHQLCDLFGLSKAEVAVLQTCIALRMDPSLNNQLGIVQNRPGHNQLSDYAISRLWCFGRAFTLPSNIGLTSWDLVGHVRTENGLVIDQHVYLWLLGDNALHPKLHDRSYIQNPKQPVSCWPMEAAIDYLRHSSEDGRPGIVQVRGRSGMGRKTFAACVARELGLALLLIDTNDLDDAQLSDLYATAQRQAFLSGCAIAWANLERILPAGQSGRLEVDFPIQFIIAEESSGNLVSEHLPILSLKLPALRGEDKYSLLESYVSDFEKWSSDCQNTAINSVRTVSDIAQLAQCYRGDVAALRQRTTDQNNRHLSGFAARLPTPFTRDDWVVNERINRIVDDIVYEAQTRESVLESDEIARLFPRGKGLVAMFSGPSGTGKTMGAQVVARELGLDLYRVDLSRVVSKYIGETAENLAAIITQAEQLNVVVLFDEADALFSNRTDVKDSLDRHANMDVNYLLQAIEDYSGIAFLATNKKSNIDQSFIRRLRYVVEFPLPEYPQRLLLWQRLIVNLAPDQIPEQMGVICEQLARQVELSGAQIKYSVLSALFIARRLEQLLNIDHLIEGIVRELQKEGRSLAEHERASIVNVLSGEIKLAAPSAV